MLLVFSSFFIARSMCPVDYIDATLQKLLSLSFEWIEFLTIPFSSLPFGGLPRSIRSKPPRWDTRRIRRLWKKIYVYPFGRIYCSVARTREAVHKTTSLHLSYPGRMGRGNGGGKMRKLNNTSTHNNSNNKKGPPLAAGTHERRAKAAG